MVNYIISPSLERIATFKIVSFLWNQNDIRTLIENHSSKISEFQWQKIEVKVHEKVSCFHLPEPLKEKIDGVVRTIGLEIFRWIHEYYNFSHRFFDNAILHLPSEFFLTPIGTIDKQKTAELLIKDETLCIERRFRLACIYCLEDYLPDLWNKLPEYTQHKYYSPDRPSMEIHGHIYTIYFTYALKGELHRPRFNNLRQPYCVTLFERAIQDGNIVAIEYFYKKMTPIDQKVSLLKEAGEMIRYHRFSSNLLEVFCFLLSQMNEEEQISVLRPNFVLNHVLLSMLDWPWQVFLMETVDLMRSFIPLSMYEQLLQRILYKVIEGDKDSCYQDIFTELCLRIPDEERYNILHKVCASSSLLAHLFKIKGKQNIKLIFEDATPEFKKEFILTPNGMGICCKLMLADNWNLLEFYIQDCIQTKDELVNFKENFHDIVRSVLNFAGCWSKFICLIDCLICKYEKRKSEGESSSDSGKKLRSINLKNDA